MKSVFDYCRYYKCLHKEFLCSGDTEKIITLEATRGHKGFANQNLWITFETAYKSISGSTLRLTLKEFRHAIHYILNNENFELNSKFFQNTHLRSFNWHRKLFGAVLNPDQYLICVESYGNVISYILNRYEIDVIRGALPRISNAIVETNSIAHLNQDELPINYV